MSDVAALRTRLERAEGLLRLLTYSCPGCDENRYGPDGNPVPCIDECVNMVPNLEAARAFLAPTPPEPPREGESR